MHQTGQPVSSEGRPRGVLVVSTQDVAWPGFYAGRHPDRLLHPAHHAATATDKASLQMRKCL